MQIICSTNSAKVAASAALKANNDDDDLKILSLSMMDLSPLEYETEEFATVIDAVQILFQMNGEIGMATSKDQVKDIITAKFDDSTFRAFVQSNVKHISKTNGDSDGFKFSFNIDEIQASIDHVLRFPTEANEIFRGPMMLLKGSDSNFVRSKHMDDVAKKFPLYNLQSVRKAGHWLHADQPEASSQIISKFITSVTEYYFKKNKIT